MGGGSATTSTALQKLLAETDTTWAAAVDGSQSAAQLELDSNTPVMAIGGWSSDPTPTLAEFEASVAEGKIGYYIASGNGTGRHGWRVLHGVRDLGVGGGELLVDDRRRPDRLRPEPRSSLCVMSDQ